MRNALGDLEVQVLRTVVQGDMVAAHCHVVARLVGEALGGPPTGKPVDFFGITIARVADGKLIEGWNVFDFLSMYQQLGWVRQPVAPQSGDPGRRKDLPVGFRESVTEATSTNGLAPNIAVFCNSCSRARPGIGCA